MKNAPIIQTTNNEGAADTANYTTSGILPARCDTVIAAVLAALLEGRELTGMDSVIQHNTTRLGGVIYQLERTYGWHIERRDIATGTSDGRIATITAYWLTYKAVAQAFDAGASEWIDRVHAARAERRQRAGKCKVEAARQNAAKV